MKINLLEIINNTKKKIDIKEDIVFSSELFIGTSIRKLNNVKFKGSITKLIDDSYELTGILSGEMILPDDITLEDYKYSFSTEVEEELDENEINLQKSIDISNVLWQNIIVEIPLRSVNPENENIKLEGDGWRLISEEEVKTENNPLCELEDLLGKE